MNASDSKLGAALLGLYGAIRIARQEGYDPRKLFELMNDDDRIEDILGARIYDDIEPKEPTNAIQT